MGTPYIGEIRLMAFTFPPKGWAQCNGQLLAINQNQPLFALLGTTYGGDGRTNFALPDLRGRAPIHAGSGASLGERAGEEAHTLTAAEMPAHGHTMIAHDRQAVPAGGRAATPPGPTTYLARANAISDGGVAVPVHRYAATSPTGTMAPAAIGATGGNQPHPNRQPYLGMEFCIALQGIFPSRN